MLCPKCGTEMALVERYRTKDDVIVRVYQCPKCSRVVRV